MSEFTNLLFIDIESAPKVKEFDNVDDRSKSLFRKKFAHEIDSYSSIAESVLWMNKWREKAALYAEFSRVVCVSMGLISETIGGFNIKLHSIINRNEKALLNELSVVLNKIPNHILVGHNIKDFDCPFLTRRYYANGIKLPTILNIGSKKPWEISWKDTMEMWGAGQFKYKCSLDLLCNVFGIESPKQDMDGSQVAYVFYYESKSDELPFDKEAYAFKKISTYCENDVKADAECYLVMIGEERKIVSISK